MNCFFLRIRTKWLSLFTIFFLLLVCLKNQSANASSGVTVYTPFTKISIPPGESIDYSIDFINNSGEVQNLDISVIGLPANWSYILKSGAWNVRQLSILPGEKKSLSLKIEVPMQVDKGSYRFKVLAGNTYSLSLTVFVSEQGTFKTEFTTKQANMVGHSNSTFTYSADLKNRTADKQLYALKSEAPRGWDVVFKSSAKSVTSVDMEANSTEHITIDVNPPDEIEAGTYKIPVMAYTNTTSAELILEAVITGSYNIELTTPKGLLSTSITAGSKKQIDLLVKNTGSSELTDIKLKANAPINWEINFNPVSINKLEPGSEATVIASLKADRKSIAGDYVTNIEAKTPEVSSKVSFRISVKTSMLWGWVGILIILIGIGSIYYLFRKYGRR